jgi:hypothetical protein
MYRDKLIGINCDLVSKSFQVLLLLQKIIFTVSIILVSIWKAFIYSHCNIQIQSNICYELFNKKDKATKKFSRSEETQY